MRFAISLFSIVATSLMVACSCVQPHSPHHRTFDANAIIAEVRAAEARYDAATSMGDYTAIAEFVTRDFVYIDISGNRMTPQSLLA